MAHPIFALEAALTAAQKRYAAARGKTKEEARKALLVAQEQHAAVARTLFVYAGTR